MQEEARGRLTAGLFFDARAGRCRYPHNAHDTFGGVELRRKSPRRAIRVSYHGRVLCPASRNSL